MELSPVSNAIENKKLHSFKLITLGESGTGKSAILFRFFEQRFETILPVTIGMKCNGNKIIYIDDLPVKLQLWDTAGQERFNALGTMYYNNAEAAIVVYDINVRKSFVYAKKLIEDLRNREIENIVIALAGNKAETTENRQVFYEEAAAYADENDFIFFETSALTALNIHDLFLEVAKKLSKINIEYLNEYVILEKEDAIPNQNCCVISIFNKMKKKDRKLK